jgi:hypothetical protein
MHGEQNKLDRDDTAGIWRDAQHRRNEDLGVWLRRFFEKPRQPTSVDVVPASAAAQ